MMLINLNKDKRRCYLFGKLFFVLFFVLFFMGMSSAKFVCGEIVSDGVHLPSWYEVNISLVLNSSIMTTCQVNPYDFKYCCDIESLFDLYGYSWEVGDSFRAEIVDFDSNMIAGPVFVSLSSDSYDVVPKMELRKVFDIREPQSNVFISSEGNFFVDMNIFDGCDLGRIINSSREVLCEDGCDYRSEFDLGFGFNELKFYASCGGYEFFENVSGFVISDFVVERSLDKKIKNKEGILVDLSLDISHSVEGVKFREYVPVFFDVIEISNGGELEVSTSNYNVIVWDLNGSVFDFSYSITPMVSGDFSFISELDGNFGFEENVTVYDFVPPIGKSGGGSGGYFYRPKNLSRVSEDMGIVYEFEDLTAALYSKNFTDKGAFEIFEFNFSDKLYNRSLKLISGYLFETNLGDNIGLISFEYDLGKDYLKENKYSDIEVYGVGFENRLFKLNGNVVLDDFGNEKFVSYDNDYFSKVVFFGVKEKLSLWDRILDWIWKVF